MLKINRQLGRHFISVTMFSVIFITVLANLSINLLFSGYVRESRERNDLKVVQYIGRLYSENNGFDAQVLMSIMHYAYGETIKIRMKDDNGDIIWDSGIPETMHGMMGGDNSGDSRLTFRTYPFGFLNSRIKTIEIGRTKSIIASMEDKQFFYTMNMVFVAAFLISLAAAHISSKRLSEKFLHPIYRIKENARLIEEGKFGNLQDVKTNTAELHDLSVSIRELADRLEHQDVLRKRMTSDIAHELRTPLATIQSHIEAFMDGVWEPEHEKFAIIHDEIVRLTKLIKDLSELSVFENEKVTLNKRPVNISELLNRATERFEPMLYSISISVEKEIQDDVHFLGDADRLNQVLVNILSNAYKYTNEKGMVRICLKQSEKLFQITIQDTGIGISPEDLKHIFERLYRSDRSRTRETGGTGVGLTIARTIVEAHGGRIHIESEEHKGTTVLIEFERTN